MDAIRPQTSRTMPLSVQVRGLSKQFGDHVALNAVDLELCDGEFVALIGKSGSGKTTLLRILAGLETPDEGTVLVPRERTVVFQEPRLVPSKQVWKNVVIGLDRSSTRREEAIETLRLVGLESKAEVWPATLSGGEAQRVALARALLRWPKLLLLDEPFASLDALTRLQMQDLVRSLIAKFTPATIIVTHDVEEALLLADRIVLLRDGKFAFEIEVTMPRPRSLDGAEFDRLRRMLLGELGVHL